MNPMWWAFGYSEICYKFTMYDMREQSPKNSVDYQKCYSMVHMDSNYFIQNILNNIKKIPFKN